MAVKKHVLIILTSHGQLDAEHPTGLWLEEFSAAYEVFSSEGIEMTLASPKGGKIPVDPSSLGKDTDNRYLNMLNDTQPVAKLDFSEFAAVYFPGGHGTMFDLPTDPGVKQAVEYFSSHQKIIASVCHGVAALVAARDENNQPIVKNKKITSFTNQEEHAAGLEKKVPFLLETRLSELGAQFIGKPNWSEHVVIDGLLISGQNPQSTQATAKALCRALQ